MEITKLTTQARNPNRINLYVDGKFYRGLDKIVAIQLGLRPGLTLTSTLIQRLEKHQYANSAWEWALKSLQRSAQSEWQLRRKLAQRFPENMVDDTIRRLQNQRLLDDEQLAGRMAARYMAAHKSHRQILLLMRTKGIAQPIAQAAVSQLPVTYPQTAALMLARRKYRQLPTGEWRIVYPKIVAYLSSRGFNYATIRQVATREALETEELA